MPASSFGPPSLIREPADPIKVSIVQGPQSPALSKSPASMLDAKTLLKRMDLSALKHHKVQGQSLELPPNWHRLLTHGSPSRGGGVSILDAGSPVQIDIFKPRVIDPGESIIPDADKLTKGAQTFVNVDNDDNDGTFDDTDGVVTGGDDEMVKIKLRIDSAWLAANPTAQARVEVPQGTQTVTLWKSNEFFRDEDHTYYAPGTLLLPLGGDFQNEGAFYGASMWVNGKVASAMQQAVRLRFVVQTATGSIQDEASLTVIGIDQIKWVGRGNSPTDGNDLGSDPNWPGYLPPTGFRVFPDARVVVATVEATPRDKVDVEVTLSVQPIEPVKLFFKPFDMDDPSAETGPVDDPQNPELAPSNELYSEDNRGGGGGVPKPGRFTGLDADGGFLFTNRIELLEFQVTMQPGDNFRIVGNGDKDLLPGLANDDYYHNNGSTIQQRNISKQKVYFKYYTDPVTFAYTELARPDLYSSRTLTVWRYLHVERDHMDAPPLGQGGPFNGEQGADDDPRPFTPLPDPTIALLQQHMVAAYVHALSDLTINLVNVIPFVHNIEKEQEQAHAGGAFRNQVSLNRFWVVQVVGAYEGPVLQDWDPNAEGYLIGRAVGIDGPTMIYLETIRDVAANDPAWGLTEAETVARTVYHEVLHRFNIVHQTPPGEEGIMGVAFNSPDPNAIKLTPAQLNLVRGVARAE